MKKAGKRAQTVNAKVFFCGVLGLFFCFVLFCDATRESVYKETHTGAGNQILETEFGER